MFVRSKVQAHRMRVLLGLSGLSVTELHGSLTQVQVIHSWNPHRSNHGIIFSLLFIFSA
jgi:hypothetical protein